MQLVSYLVSYTVDSPQHRWLQKYEVSCEWRVRDLQIFVHTLSSIALFAFPT